jgi:hypothetical protein
MDDQWGRFMSNIPPSEANASLAIKPDSAISGLREIFHSVMIFNDFHFIGSLVLQESGSPVMTVHHRVETPVSTNPGKYATSTRVRACCPT